MSCDPTEPSRDGHSEQAAAHGCEAGGLRGTLQHIVGQIGDADRRHSDALNAMQERLAQLSLHAETAREGSGQPAATAPPRPMRPAEAFEAWDGEAAEALTRLYESGEGDPRRWPGDRARPPRSWPAAAAPLPPPPRDARDERWLEARIADVVAELQGAMAEFDPAKPLAAIDARLEQMEARFGSALDDVARRCDVEGLRLVEAHVVELAAHVDRANSQLARLDAIDGQLTELAQRLDEQRQMPDASPVRLSDGAIESLIDTAAERAAARVAAGMPAPSAVDRQGAKRLDALEDLLKDYITERRRSEEQASAVLVSLEDALVRIADRVDAIEAAKPAAAPTFRQEEDEMAEVYAAGARALGTRGVAASLSAADYLPAPARSAPVDAQPVARHHLAMHQPAALAEPQAAGHDVARHEPVLAEPPLARHQLARHKRPKAPPPGLPADFRPAAMRAKLRAQAAAVPVDLDEVVDAADSPFAADAAQSGGGPRPTFLIAAAAALLFGAGYLVVDAFLSRAPAPRPAQPQGALQLKQDAAPASEIKPVRAEPRAIGVQPPAAAAEAAGPVAPPGAEVRPDDKYETLLPSAPRPHRVPETVTDDLSLNDIPPGNARVRALAGAMASAFAATPVAVPSSEAATPGSRLALGEAASLVPLAIGPAALRHAALKGDPAAECEIAARYAEGKGVPQDIKQAFGWYQRAAMRGYAPAQYSLGRLFERGVGVGTDIARAKVWYARAAEQGHVRAMHNLAVLSAGDRMSADHVAAARWFTQAAERGLTDSQYNLAVLYQTGRGVEKDLAQAYKWFALAARSGDAEATARLAEVKAQLAPPLVQGLEAQVAAWRPRASETAAAAGARPEAH